MIVVDSSALADHLARRPEAEWVERQLDASGWRLHAPHLLDIEVASAFRRLSAVGELAPDVVSTLLDLLVVFPLSRYPHSQLLDRIWSLRATLSAQDASYVALAEALDAPLLTTDRRLARSHGHRAEIIAP